MTEAKKMTYVFGADRTEGTVDMRDILGGKGASLAHMSREGLPVPPGFTISAECCGYYFSHDKTWPPGLEAQVHQQMQRLEEVTDRRFGKAPRPLLVSVRSGAAVSMPGMMDTILNTGLHPGLCESWNPITFWYDYAEYVSSYARSVTDMPADAFEEMERQLRRERGRSPEDILSPEESEELAKQFLEAYKYHTGEDFSTDPGELLRRAINAVFESWTSARAIHYRQHHGIRRLTGTAVNVQAMFPSEVSGVLFTVNPNTGNSSEMIIEAARGLGELVVSGRVSPDIYVLDRETMKAKESPGENGCLAEKHLRELGELALKVEEVFGHAADIEWGLAEGKLVLLQARRIAGLDVVMDLKQARLDEIANLKALAGDQTKVWCIHNLAETIPAPRPLSWDIVSQFMSGAGGFGRMYKELGYVPSKQIDERGFLDLIGGRIYADLTRAPELFFDRFPLKYDLDKTPEDMIDALDAPPQKSDFTNVDPRFYLRLPYYLYKMLATQRQIKKQLPAYLKRLQEEILPPYLSYVEETRKMDLGALSDEELLEEFDARLDRVMNDFGKESIKPTFFAGLCYGMVEGTLCSVLGEAKGKTIGRQLVMGLGGDKTLEADAALYDVAYDKRIMDSFLEEYGHRGINEFELAQPRWREDPNYLKRILATYRHPDTRPPQEHHEEQKARREELEAKLPEMFAAEGGAFLLDGLRQDLKDAQTYMPWRETAKHYLMMGYELLRWVLEELGCRWELDSDIHFLCYEELFQYRQRQRELKQEIARRKVRWQALQRIELPEVIRSDDLSVVGKPMARFAVTNELEGMALASGVAEGVAQLLRSPDEARDLENYIIVCPSTDPGWTPLFVRAVALVVERGGMLSHGAVVARDFGIPAVRITGAMRRIPDGAKLRVDGNESKVYIL